MAALETYFDDRQMASESESLLGRLGVDEAAARDGFLVLSLQNLNIHVEAKFVLRYLPKRWEWFEKS